MVCYAYLSDVTGNINSEPFKNSLWFTRGWTLQELLAPQSLIFFDQEWRSLGTKAEYRGIVSLITGIPAEGITGFNLTDFCVADTMRFAATRQTTREEDRAYSLLGMFGVNMPLIYGEGTRAFTRLQEEIVKSIDDLTILAWESCDERAGIFAHAPSDFDHEIYLRRTCNGGGRRPFSGEPEPGPLLSATGLSVSVKLLPIRRSIYLATTGHQKGSLAEAYVTFGMMLQEAEGSYRRCYNSEGKCLFKLPNYLEWQTCRRMITINRESISHIDDRYTKPMPPLAIDIGPGCGHVTRFCLTSDVNTDLNVDSLEAKTSLVGIFDIIHMQLSSTDAQFLLFGFDHDWRPFCLAVRNGQRSLKICTPDAHVYIPQLGMRERTVGDMDDMMTLVKAMKSQGSQRWDSKDGSVELHVLSRDESEIFFYLASAHHVFLSVEYDTAASWTARGFHIGIETEATAMDRLPWETLSLIPREPDQWLQL